MIPDSNASDQQAELFAAFGQVMFEAQSLERGLSIVLAMVYGPTPGTVTQSEVRRLVESYFQKPLGALKNFITEIPEVSGELKGRLKDAVTRRNFIAHHYFWERAAKSKTVEGRAEMAQELEENRRIFSTLAGELFEMYMEWLRDHMVSQRQIDEALALARE